MAESVRKPRSLAQAQRLCELFAEIDGRIAAMEEARDAAIAKANAVVDADLAPLLTERALIAEKLGPWFIEAKGELLPPKRKSIELGGCELGTRSATAQLSIAGDEKDMIASLEQARWAKPLLRRSVALDKRALLKALDGPNGETLAQLGFASQEGEERFFIKRTAQAGTQAKVG